jgi:hypothetical protein
VAVDDSCTWLGQPLADIKPVDDDSAIQATGGSDVPAAAGAAAMSNASHF